MVCQVRGALRSSLANLVRGLTIWADKSGHACAAALSEVWQTAVADGPAGPTISGRADLHCYTLLEVTLGVLRTPCTPTGGRLP